MKESPMCIAIDGPSASGKSTIAKEIAKTLGFIHLDTGAIYRSIAKWCLDQGIPTDDQESLLDGLKKFHYTFDVQNGENRHFINGSDVTGQIRTPEVSQLSSKIAAFPKVRLFANEIQRESAKGRSVVIDARDAGTVVFPEADVKVFLTAKREERAKRRLKELQGRGFRGSMTLEEVLKEMEERDERDIQRESSPLKRAVDAIAIDTTHLTISKIVKKVLRIVHDARPREPSRFWVALVGRGRANTPFLYKFLLLLTYGLLRLVYRVRVYGREHIPKGPAIIAPNHVSYLDPFVVGVLCPYELFFLAKEPLFRIPIGGRILRKMNTLPVTGNVQDTAVLRQIAAYLMKGKQVMIFPEGGRSDDGLIKPLKRGVALLASTANAAVVPTFVLGPLHIWPRKKKFPKLWGTISVFFDEPLYWRDYVSDTRSKRESETLMTQDLEARLKAMHAKYSIEKKG